MFDVSILGVLERQIAEQRQTNYLLTRILEELQDLKEIKIQEGYKNVER